MSDFLVRVNNNHLFEVVDLEGWCYGTYKTLRGAQREANRLRREVAAR